MTALKLASRGLLAAALITGLSGVARAADDIDRVSLEGTLGQERIGMTLLIKNGKTLSGGHYFMAATSGHSAARQAAGRDPAPERGRRRRVPAALQE